jgi:apolipoprotein N-acyltransferase
VTNFLKRLKHFQPQIFPILSGILAGTSYPPFPSWAVTFCWVPLWFAIIDEENPKKVFWKAWVTQFVLTLIGFHWIAHTAHDFGELPWSVSSLALLLFCALMHLHIPVSLTLAKWIDKKTHGLAAAPQFFLLCALLQLLIERVWPMIFPWHLGYSVLYSRLEIAQLAEIVGFRGLSSLFFLFNALFAIGIWYSKEKKTRAWILISSGVLVFFVLNITGALIHPKVQSDKTLTALIVQANIGQLDKIEADLANANHGGGSIEGRLQEVIMQKFIDLTNEGLQAHPETQVIVWPETAMPDFYDMEYLSRPRQMKLRDQIQQWHRALITGAYSHDFKTQKVYNALFVFDDVGNLAAPAFRKSELLAFGEYLPFGDEFPILYKFLPFASSFGRGKGPEVQTFHIAGTEYKVAPQICYESLYDQFARKEALLAPDFIVNITNDSWFGTTFEPFQHGTMNWARAIETRRPLIRSTNTGQSSVILQDGKVLVRSPLEQEWYGAATIPLVDPKPTFFMLWGHLDWIVYLVILLILLGRIKSKHV